MLNKYKIISIKNRKNYVEKNIRITLFMIRKIKKIFIYNGHSMPEKKICFFDLNNLTGQYVFTRKMYAKPEKFFKFKY